MSHTAEDKYDRLVLALMKTRRRYKDESDHYGIIIETIEKTGGGPLDRNKVVGLSIKRRLLNRVVNDLDYMIRKNADLIKSRGLQARFEEENQSLRERALDPADQI